MYVIIAGAGLVGQQIARLLHRNDHDVVAIDTDQEVLEQLYAETGVLTVHGSATSHRVLIDAGAEKADVIVCLMARDADNIACAIIAQSLGVPKRLARLKDPSYEEAYKTSGITRIMRVVDLLINQLMVEIEQPEVKKVMSLGGGSADVYAIRIPPEAWCIDKPVSNIGSLPEFPRESLLMGVFRHDTEEFAIPRGSFVLQEGDTVFMIARPGDVKQMADILTRTRKNRLLRIMKGEKDGS
jgi:trk system potassium uptake protein TrkA